MTKVFEREEYSENVWYKRFEILLLFLFKNEFLRLMRFITRYLLRQNQVVNPKSLALIKH